MTYSPKRSSSSSSPEEETADSIRTIQAWAVDVPDSRGIGLMLIWLRRSDLDASELGHLKRVRKQNNTSTFLLSVSTSPSLSSEPRCLFRRPHLDDDLIGAKSRISSFSKLLAASLAELSVTFRS
ncbi:hypothetical protein B0H14DRAFT_687834 [Mycena olivaceomarginata]|nr:hypothetical protein B0H14DRAFT_687834 [Mycena olivaceomarginata]